MRAGLEIQAAGAQYPGWNIVLSKTQNHAKLKYSGSVHRQSLCDLAFNVEPAKLGFSSSCASPVAPASLESNLKIRSDEAVVRQAAKGSLERSRNV